MRRPRLAPLLAVPLLLLAGCLSEGAVDAPSAEVPARTANDGPGPYQASLDPFRIPGDDATVFHPIAMDGLWLPPASFTHEAALPRDACLTREPVVLQDPFGGDGGAKVSRMPGGAVHLTAEVAHAGGAPLTVAFLGPQIPHAMAGPALREPSAWPALDGGPMPALAVRCDGGSSTLGGSVRVGVTLQPVTDVLGPEVPYLLTVPEDATRLALRPFRLNETPVVSHFTLLREDGSLLGHYGLNSYEAAQIVDLPGPGRYVLHVDHVLGGFVQAALDAPGGRLEPLALDFVDLPLREGPGDAEATLPPGALSVLPWVEPPGTGSARWEGLTVTLTGGRGKVFEWQAPDRLTLAPGPGARWGPLGLAPQEFVWDHHAVLPGAASAAVRADLLEGRVGLRVAVPRLSS